MTIAGPTVWPERLVAAPRGRIGTPSSAAIDTAATTSLDGPRHDHAQGLDLVEAGVGRIEPAHPAVEVDLGARLAAQAVGQTL